LMPWSLGFSNVVACGISHTVAGYGGLFKEGLTVTPIG